DRCDHHRVPERSAEPADGPGANEVLQVQPAALAQRGGDGRGQDGEHGDQRERGEGQQDHVVQRRLGTADPHDSRSPIRVTPTMITKISAVSTIATAEVEPTCRRSKARKYTS